MFKIVPIHQWNQRVEPKPGTAIGQVQKGWQLYSVESHDLYEQTGVYLGFNLVVVCPKDFVRKGDHERKPKDFPQ